MNIKEYLWATTRLLAPLVVGSILFTQALADGLDLRVYWAAAKEFVSGGNLYAPGLPGTPYGGMAFTYPPFAAAVLAPLASLPVQTALVLQTMFNLLMAFVVGAAITSYLNRHRVLRAPNRWTQYVLTSMFICGVLLLSAPWRNSLTLGQINPLLMALIVVDLLVVSPRHPNGVLPSGILTGIAAGIKLTPLVFLMFFIIRGDWKGALRLAGTFAATAVLMAWVTPSLSIQYWGSALQDTNRVGTLSRFENISLRGFIARLNLEPSVANGLWILASGTIVLLGAVAVYRLRRQEDTWAPAAVTALVMLLISPVSWGHHWVWVVVVVAALLGRHAHATVGQPFRWRGFFTSPPGILAVLLALAFALQPPEAAKLAGSPQPYAEISTLSQIAAEAGLFVAVIVIGWFAVAAIPDPPTGRPKYSRHKLQASGKGPMAAES